MDEIIVHVEQRFKTMREFRFVEFLNPKPFHAYEKKSFFSREEFSILDVYKNLLDLDGLKCELKSVYTADFAKKEDKKL